MNQLCRFNRRLNMSGQAHGVFCLTPSHGPWQCPVNLPHPFLLRTRPSIITVRGATLPDLGCRSSLPSVFRGAGRLLLQRIHTTEL